jgi:hypothetical protein
MWQGIENYCDQLCRLKNMRSSFFIIRFISLFFNGTFIFLALYSLAKLLWLLRKGIATGKDTLLHIFFAKYVTHFSHWPQT